MLLYCPDELRHPVKPWTAPPAGHGRTGRRELALTCRLVAVGCLLPQRALNDRYYCAWQSVLTDLLGGVPKPTRRSKALHAHPPQNFRYRCAVAVGRLPKDHEPDRAADSVRLAKFDGLFAFVRAACCTNATTFLDSTVWTASNCSFSVLLLQAVQSSNSRQS